uniref:Uncharacterized protein n=1 Tax=Oryza glumipatula TaxID=40148 RepID=A0A0E0B0B4_9ORYZ
MALQHTLLPLIVETDCLVAKNLIYSGKEVRSETAFIVTEIDELLSGNREVIIQKLTEVGAKLSRSFGRKIAVLTSDILYVMTLELSNGVFCKTSYTNPPIPKPPPLLSRRGFRPELPPEGGGGGGYRRWQRWLKAVAAWRVEPAAGFPPSSQIRWTRRWKAEAARRVDAAAAALSSAVVAVVRPPPFPTPYIG